MCNIITKYETVQSSPSSYPQVQSKMFCTEHECASKDSFTCPIQMLMDKAIRMETTLLDMGQQLKRIAPFIEIYERLHKEEQV